ncbi:MAG: hypothetical protein ACRCSM_02110 [Sediminibacterium sp.]|jgi:hypothetical protein|nr:hypothetical protein [Chitinophagaceae bacterium]MCA6446890.1 hypothetical protein [Chitinophagaceae bacterium]
MKALCLNRELWIQHSTVPSETIDVMLCRLRKRKILAYDRAAIQSKPYWHTITISKAVKMKNYTFLIHPLGTAWCLLKTQFAKKPKNPV